jgi:hypothetical protein
MDMEQQRLSLVLPQVAESRASGELEEERKKVTAKMEVGSLPLPGPVWAAYAYTAHSSWGECRAQLWYVHESQLTAAMHAPLPVCPAWLARPFPSLLQELAKVSAHNSDLSQQVASLNAELVKEHKGTDALKAELAALKATVASPPAPTPAAAAAAGAGGSSRTPLGRTAGGRSAKRKRTEAAPEDEEMQGRCCCGLLVLVLLWAQLRQLAGS